MWFGQIVTHSNFKSSTFKSTRITKWQVELSDFDFKVEHKKGKDNVIADALSRQPFIATVTKALDVTDIFDLKTHQRNDPDLSKIVQKLEEGQHQARYLLRNGLLFRKTRNGDAKAVIPVTLIPSVLRAKHDDPTSGHLGVRKTLNRVKARYYFANMKKRVEEYVRGCNDCQRKPFSGLPIGQLRPILVSRP